MKTLIFFFLFFASSAWSQRQEGSGTCNKTFKSSGNNFVSSLAANATSSSILCAITASNELASLRFDPDGVVHASSTSGNRTNVRSFAFLPLNGNRNQMSMENNTVQVQQSNLEWDFQNQSVTPSAIRLNGQNCMSSKTTTQQVPLTTSAGFDLKACPGVVVADLGETTVTTKAEGNNNKITPILRRNENARLAVANNGKILTCSLAIGKMFSYRTYTTTIDTKGDRLVITQKGYDPCFPDAVGKFPQLTPAEAIKVFKQQNPRNKCINPIYMDDESALKYKKVSENEIPENQKLTGNEQLQITLHPPATLSERILRFGHGENCPQIANLVKTATTSGTSQINSGRK